MIFKEVILRDVEIPDGYEPTGECRIPMGNDTFLPCVRIILRKIPAWRDPVLPADAGKCCRASDDNEQWWTGRLRGYLDGYFETFGGRYKFCQVCDE
jgi:hypothetical protein